MAVVVGGEGSGGVEAVDTSAADKLARSRSSKFNFCRGFSEGVMEGNDALLVMGAAIRFVPKDLRKLEMADSAS